MCQGIFLYNKRTIQSYSKRKSCPKNLSKFGLRYSTISIPSSICLNLAKWSSSPLTVSLQDQKWTINAQEGLRAPVTTRNLSKDSTVITSKTPLTVRKISRTTQFRPVRNSWRNWTKWSTFSSRKKSKKTTTGKTSVLSSQDLTAREKVSTRSWNGSEPTSINSTPTTVTAYTEPTLTWSCWV